MGAMPDDWWTRPPLALLRSSGPYLVFGGGLIAGTDALRWFIDAFGNPGKQCAAPLSGIAIGLGLLVVGAALWRRDLPQTRTPP